MNQVKTLMAIALSLPVLFLSGCKSVPRYSSDYANARASIQGIPLDDAKALEIGSRFTSAFNTLGTPKFVENAGALYADQLFINDTLSQFSSRKKLLEHFQGMNQRVSNVTVSLLNIVKLLYYSYRIRKKLEITHRLSRSTILYAYV